MESGSTTEQVGLFEKLAEALVADDAALQPPCGEQELSAFEAAHNVTLPRSLWSYLTVFNGTTRSDFDTHLNAFWSLREFEPLADLASECAELLGNHNAWFVIADHSMGIDYVAMNLATGEVAVVSPRTETTSGWWMLRKRHIYPGEVIKRFSTLEEFVETYLRDPLEAFA